MIEIPENETNKTQKVNCTKKPNPLVQIVKLVSKYLFIFKEKPSKELENSLKFLKWGISSSEIKNFSIISSLVVFSLFTLINMLYTYLTHQISIVLTLTELILPLTTYYLILSYPITQSKLIKINAISESPKLLTQIIIALKQNPNLEYAIYNTLKYNKGNLSEELKQILWKNITGEKTNLKAEITHWGEKWSEILPEFKRSIYLIISALSEKNEMKRNDTLDKAIQLTIDGSIQKIKEYANNLYIPTLILFSFGTIIPLVIISLLPIISFIGKDISSPIQMFSLLLISLIIIYLYSNKIITQRPPAFSNVTLLKQMKGFPKPGNIKIKINKFEIEFNAIFYTLSVLVLTSTPGLFYLVNKIYKSEGLSLLLSLLNGYNTLFIVWGVGIAFTLYTFGTTWFKKKERDKIATLEKEMIDGFYQIASRINEGRSPESAINFVANSMKRTSFGNLMKDTYNLIKNRNVILKHALFDPNFGTLSNISSENLKISFELFLNSIKKGSNFCAQTLFMISNHYETLQKTERLMKETLKNSISMMRITVSLLAPIITGLVVTLQQMIQNSITITQERLTALGYNFENFPLFNTPMLNVEILQLIAGLYMLFLALILIRYITYIENGKDEVMLGTEIKNNIPLALFIYTLVLIISRAILI